MKKQFTLQLNSPKVASLTLGESSSPICLDSSKSVQPRARALVDTTEHWMQKRQYIPARGEIIVYSDRNIIDDKYYPGVKIGDGGAYLIDLPFVGDDIAYQILAEFHIHTEDMNIHVTTEEKDFWNNKLNLVVIGDNLIFNRS